MLARRGIKAVIRQKKDEIAARKHKSSAGGRPPHLDADIYGRPQRRRAARQPRQAVTDPAMLLIGISMLSWDGELCQRLAAGAVRRAV